MDKIDIDDLLLLHIVQKRKRKPAGYRFTKFFKELSKENQTLLLSFEDKFY